MKIGLFLFAAYISVAGLAYIFQRKLQYIPSTERVLPESVDLTDVQEIILRTLDGFELINWYSPARDGRPTILFFQGNAGALWHRYERFAFYRNAGLGVFFFGYRGYGGSGGRPSEQKLVDDAELAMEWLIEQGVSPDKIVIVGESLGSGVAVQLAARHASGMVILEAPFASAAEIGAKAYPWLPVHWFMIDKFESINFINKINSPLVIFHGRLDNLVPISSGLRLFQAAMEPKKFVELENASHNDLGSPDILGQQIKFIGEESR